MRLHIIFSDDTPLIKCKSPDKRVNVTLSEEDTSRINAIAKFKEENSMETAVVIMEDIKIDGLILDSSLTIDRYQCRLSTIKGNDHISFEVITSNGYIIMTEAVPLGTVKSSGDALEIYVDGSCLGNPGKGGAAAIVVDKDKIVAGTSKHSGNTTNNRMEIRAAIEGVRLIPHGKRATLYSDSQYVVNTINKNWNRKKNNDLWDILDKELGSRTVSFVWVRGHNGNKFNEIVDDMARQAAET